MTQNKRDKIQIQKKVQRLYRKIKQQRMKDMKPMDDYSDIDDLVENKLFTFIVRILVVLGIIFLVLDAFIKGF